jgi:para-nitrobenzyl esterase
VTYLCAWNDVRCDPLRALLVEVGWVARLQVFKRPDSRCRGPDMLKEGLMFRSFDCVLIAGFSLAATSCTHDPSRAESASLGALTQDPCLVTIDSGAVQGALVGQTCRYLGIPYAASPAGNQRWRPPTPAPVGGLFHADGGFGNMCPQVQVINGVPTAVGKEDCLNVNVYAPTGANQPLPVIFFMHGGGNRTNSNRAEAGESLDGQYLAEHGPAVVVTINYRLGALGWLAHSSLDAERRTSGNYGILDQIEALKWVRDHIAAFGGDPSRVTITGHSAGAQDSGVLLASALAKSLFANVLIDGAGPANFNNPSLADYEAGTGADVVSRLGCAAAADIPACLRAVPPDTIVLTVPGSGGLISSTYTPIVDGLVLQDTVQQTAKVGAHNHVPLVIGGTDKESSNPLAFVPVGIDTPAKYRAFLDTLFAGVTLFGLPVTDQVLALYPVKNYPSARMALVAATTDYRWICPARRLARAVSNSQREPVYRFLFTHAQSGPSAATALGAWHGEELMFIFHNCTSASAPCMFTSGVSGPFTPTAAELTLSDEMIGYWTRFAATGNPNGDSALPWFTYNKNADNNGRGHMFFDTNARGDDKKDTFLQFDTPLTEGAGSSGELCDGFWDVLAGDTNNGHGGSGIDSSGPGMMVRDLAENAGNEPFLTPADLDGSDQH